jgi:hypothetical protein
MYSSALRMDARLEYRHCDRYPSFRNTRTRPNRCHQEEIAQGKLRPISGFMPILISRRRYKSSHSRSLSSRESCSPRSRKRIQHGVSVSRLFNIINSADLPADDGILYIELDKLRSVSFHPVHYISDTSTAPAHRHPSGGHTSSRIIRVSTRPSSRRRTPS